MKKTSLYDEHLSLGAKMIEFAGYSLPLEYRGIQEEHLSVRTQAGLFDVSHMGEIIVKGDNAFGLVQRLTSNDISKLSVGKAQYSCFPNEQGGIIDDVLVYQTQEQEYLLVVNAANVAKDWKWISEQNRKEQAEIANISDTISQIALQGKVSAAIIQPLLPASIMAEEIKYYTFVKTSVAACDEVLLSATGYTGEKGFEIYCKAENAPHIWRELLRVGKPLGLCPVGLGARDTLRLEKGYSLYGQDLSDSISPIEAGLSWICKFNERNPFISSDLLKLQKEEGVKQQKCGFKMVDRGVPRTAYRVVNKEGIPIGEVTSGTFSPSLKIGIGAALIKPQYASEGQEIWIEVRNRKLKAVVAHFPLV